jgi:hypothetical protein
MKNMMKWIIRGLMPRVLFPVFYNIKYRGQQLPNAAIYQDALRDKSGIEIGGPSIAFSNFLQFILL